MIVQRTHYQKALAIAKELGAKEALEHTLKSGEYIPEDGLVADSIEHLSNAIQIAREVGDKQSEGVHLSNVGNVYNGSGQYPEAIDSYDSRTDFSKC